MRCRSCPVRIVGCSWDDQARRSFPRTPEHPGQFRPPFVPWLFRSLPLSKANNVIFFLPAGFFATDIHDYILANPNLPKASIEKFVQRTSSGSPLMRGGDPMEIAYAILYLASTESSYT